MAEAPQVELPRYRSIKDVWAIQIAMIEVAEDGGAWITPRELGYAKIYVSADYMKKHEPRVRGYYVVYKDGYKSWSPADVFESGYLPLNH